MISDDNIDQLKQKLEEKDKLIKQLQEENERLSNYDIKRFSRQLILPNFGPRGQKKLQSSSILIVGTGGLGCPSSSYLAGCGVGCIGLVDYDTVELSNIHRQLLHSECNVGQPKVESAAAALNRIDSKVKINRHNLQLNSLNALSIIEPYDVILDATDNIATRYLLNDACVLLGKPLISGSALQMEGQLTVYNYKNCPCYRCIFPKPPPPNTVKNCGDGGVLGMIPGVIGTLQALEAIKIILNQEGNLANKLLLFNGYDTSFRQVKLRNKRPDCEVCGENPMIKTLIDYEQFCGSKASDKDLKLKVLPNDKRISVSEYKQVSTDPHLLIDVRSKEEFELCQLPDSLNVPINKINDKTTLSLINEQLYKETMASDNIPVYVVCRRGNDSQLAVQELEKVLLGHVIKDLVGGLHAWSAKVDNSFPVY